MAKIISTSSPNALGSPFQAHQGEQTQAQPTSNELSEFDRLPDEILLLIFKALAPRDLPKLNLVSRRFKKVVSSHPDIKFVKEIFMPAMQKREKDRMEFTMGLQWGIVFSYVYAGINEEAVIDLKNLFISGLSPECVSIASKCQGLEILVGSLLPGPAVEISKSLDHLKLLELCYDWPSDRFGNSILKLCPNVEFLNVS